MIKRLISLFISAFFLFAVGSIEAFAFFDNNFVNTGSTGIGISTMIGDADLNGSITVRDATSIQKHIAGIINMPMYAEAFSDTDGDGQVTIKDATVIQKYIVGFDVRGELTLKYQNSTSLVSKVPPIIGDVKNVSYNSGYGSQVK